jgi:hypothetical protein
MNFPDIPLPPPKNESPPAANQAGPEQQISEPECSCTNRKWQRVLRAFLSGRSYNRFEATRELRDWCLHTTVSQLERRGVRIDREDETVPGQFGPVHCKRYRLAPESRTRAAELLGVA